MKTLRPHFQFNVIVFFSQKMTIKFLFCLKYFQLQRFQKMNIVKFYSDLNLKLCFYNDAW